MTWNKDGAISYAKSHAQPKSTGYCAHYVTEAIRTGGRLKSPIRVWQKIWGGHWSTLAFAWYTINLMPVT